MLGVRKHAARVIPMWKCVVKLTTQHFRDRGRGKQVIRLWIRFRLRFCVEYPREVRLETPGPHLGLGLRGWGGGFSHSGIEHGFRV